MEFKTRMRVPKPTLRAALARSEASTLAANVVWVTKALISELGVRFCTTRAPPPAPELLGCWLPSNVVLTIRMSLSE